MPDLTKLEEKKKVEKVQQALLDIAEEEDFLEEVADLRQNCKDGLEFGRWVGQLCEKKFGAVWEANECDWEWLQEKVKEFEPKYETIASRAKRFGDIFAFSSLGPMCMAKGEGVKVTGLQSASGALLNGQVCLVQDFDEEKGRYEVRFVPEKIMKLKPENLKRLDDLARALSIQLQILEQLGQDEAKQQIAKLRDKCKDKGEYEHMSGEYLAGLWAPILERHGINSEWLGETIERLKEEDDTIKYNSLRYDELTGIGTLGSMDLQKGDIVNVAGLEDTEEKKLNGKTGKIRSYDKETGLYAVGIVVKIDTYEEANFSREKVVHVKGKQLLKLTDRQKLLGIQAAIIDTLTKDKEVKEKLKELRANVKTEGEWTHQYEEFFMENCESIFGRYGVDAEWWLGMTEHLQEEDEEVAKRGTEIHEISTFGSALGPLEVMKGTCVEIKGSKDTALNGQKGLIQAFDTKLEVYDVELVPKKLVQVTPKHLKVLDDQEKLVSVQLELLEAIDNTVVRTKLQKLLVDSVDKAAFEEATETLLEELRGPIYNRHGVSGDWTAECAMHLQEEERAIGVRFRRIYSLTEYMEVPAAPLLDKGANVLIGGFIGSEKDLNGQVVHVETYDTASGSYKCRLADDLAKVKEIRPKNLRHIPGKEFESVKQAKEYQEQLLKAYEKQAYRDEIERIKPLYSEADPTAHWLAARDLQLRAEAPVRERFGFRSDYGGCFQQAISIGAMEEKDPEIKRLSIKREVLLGFPSRE